MTTQAHELARIFPGDSEMAGRLDRARMAFFSDVSHEFRTPLTLMLRPLEEMLARLPPEDSDRRQLTLIHRNGLRLLKLVNALLDFSRIEAGRTQASYEATDLAGFTAEVASSFRSAVERSGLHLTIDCPPLEQPVYVDRDMWEKIVLNLVSNAVKFTFKGAIEVAVRRAGRMAELTVSDSGVGIPAAELPRIFERFHRVPGARSRTNEGAGIGLALIQEMVRLHGGEVAVQSEEGRGSRFAIRIPLGTGHLPVDRIVSERRLPVFRPSPAFPEEASRWSPQGPAETRFPAVEPERAVPGPRYRVLVADDNADMREYLDHVLRARYEVHLVADGRTALQAVCSLRPDLLLADVMMPGLDGFELIQRLRSDPILGLIPIVLLSARTGEDSRVEGLKRGADDYLIKPFSARELMARVTSHLELGRLRREVADSAAARTVHDSLAATNAELGRKIEELRQANREAQDARVAALNVMEDALEAKEALRQADRRKDEFLATLAHELRNPLAPIQNGLHLIRPAAGPELGAHQVIERQVGQLVRLVDDLLEVARITSGKIELRREPMELGAVLRQAIEVSRQRLDQAGHQLEIQLPNDPVVLHGDPVRLSQVFGNLLNNAAKFTPPGGHIRVSVQVEPDAALVSVRDSGVGIDGAMLPRLFEMFSQGHPGYDRVVNGLGIGLALVRRLVELHQGKVWAESPGPGQGSTFNVRLPVLPVETARPLPGQTSGAPAAESLHFGSNPALHPN